MKDSVLYLLCALALAQYGVIKANHNGRPCNTESSEAQRICMSANNANVLVVHRYCNKFYKCSNGKPYTYKCPSILLYDPVKEECDWPHSVECGDRPISDNDNDTSEDTDCVGEDDEGQDNNETTLPPPTDNDSDCDNVGGICNCNPEEAPSICAAENSNGILIAHENCNQFYKCDHGKPVAFTCPPDTLYNPYKEQCDWAGNVDCGDRLIPGPDDNNNGDGGSDGNDNGGNDDGGNDNGGNENEGTCNCNPDEAPSLCAAENSNGILIAHENCNQFYKCDHGKPVAFTCPPDTLYNPYKEQCDWAGNVDCGDRLIPGPDDNNNGDGGSNGNDNGGNDNGGNDNGGNENEGTCNCNPDEAPSLCAAENSNGILIAHENCNKFYKCDHGKPVVFTCPPDTLYNPYKEQCDWAGNVDCGNRLIPGPDDNNNGDGGSDGNDNGGNDNGGNDNGGNENEGTCNCNPDQAPSLCAAENSNGILIAHENCNQFYKCDHGKPVAFTCPPDTLYNPYKEQCDWAGNVDCGDRQIPGPDDNNNGDGGSDGNDNGGNDNGGNDNGGNENEGTCNCNPDEAPSLCAAENSNGILIAHENCNQFYKCDHGKPVVFTCPLDTLYNPYKEQCDWAGNVDCGDRLIPGPDDNNNGDGGSDGNDNGGNDNGGNDNGGNENEGTCNCNPDEAPSLCAAENSNGILIAHENCNQFYKCDHGKPVVFTCPPDTLYNPYKEQCDWAGNVDCGNRLIPGPDDNNNGDGGSDGNDNGGNDNGGNDNGGNENEGTCNCNPDQAPSLCAAENSNGILIAHENCNQFYKCDHGKPVVFTCPPDTLYNPYKEQCDWAGNVDCGDRLIPGPDDNNNGNGGSDGNDNGGNDNGGNDNGGNENEGTCNCNPDQAPSLCAAENSNGILIAHENCNQFYKCDHGKPVAFICPPDTLYNPYKEQCDWAGNVDCGDRLIPGPDDNINGDGGSDGNDNGGNDNGENDNGGNENEVTCNCNPDEAPSICAAENSNGILIAHENCNQFYKCDHGKPVAFTCPPNTLYNPNKEQCDWAGNVDCGDRLIPGPDDNNDDGGSDGNDNGDNDNGGNDNGGNENEGTCNCNPDEAPTICAGADSEGILIAHVNCNQFYKCNHGKPVVFTCPSHTFYNPYNEKCEWSSNVVCGDRVIPESGEDENLSSDSDGDIDDNLPNDNENSGTCNCNPGEAPTICANADSDGILIAHENCNQFYKCSHGKPVVFTCPPSTVYDPYKEQCNWVANVDCGDRLVPDPDDNDSGGSDNGGNDNDTNDNGENDNDGNDNGGNGNEGNDNSGSENEGTDNDGNENDNNGSDCDDDNGNDIGSTCNCNPEEAPSICAGENSNGVLIAHENCNQFYKCSYGSAVSFTCPGTLLYNPLKEECDWPNKVDCGDRVIPEPKSEEDSSNDSDDIVVNDPDDTASCNCDPSEAPSICAGDHSNGILIAHENCNEFYMCSNGLPIALKCPGNTLYNPHEKECDWASKVECGNRVIPDSEDVGDDTNEGNDTDDEDNNTINDDPSQAPSICAETGSQGILVAHENCNEFYQCSGGLPIALSCAGELLFNPTTQQCDWPRNVDCGNRIIPETDDDCACNPRNAPALCSRENSDGKMIAHENCHQFCICVKGVPMARYCPWNLVYNIEKEVCDWPYNVKCDNRFIVSYSSINKHFESRQNLRK